MLKQANCGETDSYGGTILCRILDCDGSCRCGTSCPIVCPDICDSITDWIPARTTAAINSETVDGYEVKCNKTATSAKCQVRCAAGWYNPPPTDDSLRIAPRLTKTTSQTKYTYSGCTKCPSPDGITLSADPTSEAGATDPSACYIPAGTTFNDPAGAGSYTGNCDY